MNYILDTYPRNMITSPNSIALQSNSFQLTRFRYGTLAQRVHACREVLIATRISSTMDPHPDMKLTLVSVTLSHRLPRAGRSQR
jgi:hypothetical protein